MVDEVQKGVEKLELLIIGALFPSGRDVQSCRLLRCLWVQSLSAIK